MNKEKLTSVKVTQPHFDNFKIACLEDNFSLKKLVDRSIFLYITNKDFKQLLHKTESIEIN